METYSYQTSIEDKVENTILGTMTINISEEFPTKQ